MEYKLIKGCCKRTGKKFLVECREEKGELKAINFLKLTEGEYNSVKGVSFSGKLSTAGNLLACSKCSSRTVAGCNCAQKQFDCSSDKYNFQCIYCNQFEFERPVGKMPKIYVTSPRYDNIGKVLESMNIPYEQFKNRYDCDILFINCGTRDSIDHHKLSEFTKNGGCVYISDLAYTHLFGAYGQQLLQVSTLGAVCDINADIEDDELRKIIGETTKIKFDLTNWAIIEKFNPSVYPDARVIIRASALSRYSKKPIMITFKYHKGQVFYTSFHNHAQASEKEKALLQLLLLKQIGSQSNQTIEEVSSLMGLNLTNITKTFK